MRHLIRLVENQLHEEIQPTGAYYLHVTSGDNLRSVLTDGLQQISLGNYSGYYASLSGVYVTRIPAIIQHHIFARDISEDYLLVVVRVGTPGVIDEDVIDSYLQDALTKAAKKARVTPDDLAEEEADGEDYPYERVGQLMLPFMLRMLGRPVSDVSALLAEFCAAWFSERYVGGEGPGDDWWIDAKEQILRAYPAMTHRQHGADYSLRLPSPIGFDGETRIVAVVAVKEGNAEMAWGRVPPEAQKLVTDCL